MNVTKEQREELRREWVKALRSGEYEKTTGALCHEGSFCCLGVACEVAIKSGIPIEKKPSKWGYFEYDGQEGELPDSVREAYGINESSAHELINMNDGKNETFDAIAAFIEANPETVFEDGE